jgi:N-acetylglucosamine-6-sulfatase
MLMVQRCAPTEPQTTATQPAPQKPNILLILTDDQDAYPQTLSRMPNLNSLIVRQGVSFENAFVTYSLCCPSRMSILTGRYPHNHGVKGNEPPLGGFKVAKESDVEDETIAVKLNAAGYETALVGKYLNGYSGTYVPPGWDEWQGWIHTDAGPEEWRGWIHPDASPETTISHNGRLERYEGNLTDELSRRAVAFIQETNEPFFLYFALSDPHGPPIPAPRHANAFPNARVPRTPDFNETNVSDKPRSIRHLPPLTHTQIRKMDTLYRKRLGALLTVDDAIAKLVDALKEKGELDNTYIVFTSDNGYHIGQHRLFPHKTLAYDTDIRVPLMVRGPGVPQGVKRKGFALNNDLAPTFAEWASVSMADADGHSLVPLIQVEQADWRTAFLVEKFSSDESPAYAAVRSSYRLYVEYGNGAHELYDLRDDPYELRNSYGNVGQELKEDLANRLAALKDCSGKACKAYEGW